MPEDDPIVDPQIRGFNHRFEILEAAMRTLVEGLKAHDDRVVDEEFVDQKIKEVKDNLLFNEITDIEEKVKTLEANVIRLERAMYQASLAHLEEIALRNMHETAHPALPQPKPTTNRQACIREIQIFCIQAVERLQRLTTLTDMEQTIQTAEQGVNQTLQAHGFPTIRVL